MSKKNFNYESGNVLFLILIAVALFAALSYAVTQSTRSGGGSADRETSILNAASLTQYPATLRTSVIRMILNGVPVENINFDSPAEISALSLTSDDERLYMFHPNGGAAIFQQAPSEVMAGAGTGQWFFNGNFDVPQIGLDDGAGANDLIAFLPGVSSSICGQINDQIGIDASACTSTGDSDVPDIDTGAVTVGNIDQNVMQTAGGVSFPTTGDQENLEADGCTELAGQPTGCFFDQGGRFVFYSVLLER